MRSYHFTIYGNQEKKDGNPIPYFRSTQGSFFNKGSRRYQAWKDYVRASFLDGCKPLKKMPKREDFGDVHDFLQREPIAMEKDEEASMIIDIFWKNGAHADADNIFKGIADALFVNDKQISFGQFRGIDQKDKGCIGAVRVWIEISQRK